MSLTTNDVVFITFLGKTVMGRVLMASSNGDSLALSFEGFLGGYLSFMPVLRDHDGVYRDLIKHEKVTITTPEEHERSRPS